MLSLLSIAYTYRVNPNIVGYIARLNVALNSCSNVIDIESMLLFADNLWADIVVQKMNC